MVQIIHSGTLYGAGRLSADDRYEVFAFNLSQHGRDPCRDLRTLHAVNNRDPYGIFAFNNKMYVLDVAQNAIYTYQLGEKKVGFGRIIL